MKHLALCTSLSTLTTVISAHAFIEPATELPLKVKGRSVIYSMDGGGQRGLIEAEINLWITQQLITPL